MRRPLFLAVVAGGVVARTIAAQPSAPPAAEVERLRPGAVVERALARDGSFRVGVELHLGEFVEVVVEQLGIDAIVAVTGPDGAAIDEVDDHSEHDGPERVALVAPAAGIYTLTVRSEALPAVRDGRCRLAASAPRPATDDDRARSADRQAAAARLAALLARYEEMRTTGRLTAAAAGQLVDSLAESARADADAGRLRPADRALAPRGFLLLALDRSADVIAMVERRLEWLKGARYGAARATALTQLAEASSRVGESARAIALYEEALTIPQPPGGEAITRDNLGASLRRVGRLQEALDAHQRALDYFRKAGPRRSVAVVLGRLAMVWRQLGDLSRSIALETEALGVHVEVGDRVGEIRALTNLAAGQREAGDYIASRANAERALAASVETKATLAEGHASLVLANLEAKVGNPTAALTRATRAASLFRATSYKAGEAQALQAMGTAQLALGQLPEAEATLALAIEGARAVGHPDDEATALHAGATVARARGRHAEARALLEQALGSIERIRASLGGTQLRASLVSFNHGVYQAYVDVLAALHRERPSDGFDRLALEASELSRARSLLDVLATSSIDVRAGVDPALLDRERGLRQRIADKDVALRRVRDAGRTAEVTALDREIADLSAALRATESQIVASGPAFAALTRPQALSTDALRRDVLDADTVLLEYAVGGERSWLFALTPAALEIFELPGAARLVPAVRASLEALSVPPRPGPSPAPVSGPALRELSAQLLGPIAGALRGPWRGKRLVVVASGALEYVPFAALPMPDADGPGPPLVASHEVVAAPSATAIALLRREASGRAPALRMLAIVADPVFEADDPRVARARASAATRGRSAASPAPVSLVAARSTTREPLGRLPFSRREATALASMVPAADRLTVTDFAATRQWALEAPLDRYRIVHFATHGVIDTRQPALSSLVLSLVDERGAPVDGYLRMPDIYNRRLPVDLVVLSACRTALGEEVQGEGLVGLTRGFMYAGARSVVASLWQVDDQATAQLMTRFYRHMLKEGRAPSAALRAAQVELAADPRWSAPYFWAGFVLHGDWR
jgi:CHAT domain-containing protein/tetratricopeptide (TPR) repeat protein